MYSMYISKYMHACMYVCMCMFYYKQIYDQPQRPVTPAAEAPLRQDTAHPTHKTPAASRPWLSPDIYNRVYPQLPARYPRQQNKHLHFPNATIANFCSTHFLACMLWIFLLGRARCAYFYFRKGPCFFILPSTHSLTKLTAWQELHDTEVHGRCFAGLHICQCFYFNKRMKTIGKCFQQDFKWGSTIISSEQVYCICL